MDSIEVPKSLTYVGAFLSFRCRYNCSYCINKHGDFKLRKELTAKQWIKGLNRLKIDRNRMVPITLSGGEPSCHKGWLDIINGLKDDFYIDILTNLDFDVVKFMEAVPANRLQRNVPYASIRVSYHPGQIDDAILLADATFLSRDGYDIGIFAVDHPEIDFRKIRWRCKQLRLDFRTKEFLGMHNDQLYGQYKYPDALDGKAKKVKCKTTELLIAPDGDIHRCHRDLYADENSIGNILDKDLKIEFKFRPCSRYGQCSPCDIKLKNNRFQDFGTCSIDIK